jgi:hypothetical protein
MYNTITAAIITVGIVVVAFIASMSANSWIHNQGVAACIAGGRSETTIVQGDQTQKYIQPDGEWYETCFRDMGLTENND